VGVEGRRLHPLVRLYRRTDVEQGSRRSRREQRDRDVRRHGAGADDQPCAHHTIDKRLATRWVAAGTVHVPLAQRCHPRTRPAARSSGTMATPYAGMWMRAKATAVPTIATAVPQRTKAS